MRSFLASILAVLALAGLTSLPAAAGTGAHFRETMTRDRGAQISDERTALPRRRVARAAISDIDADYEARPRRRYQVEDSLERPRRAKPRHARPARHARKHTGRHRRVVGRAGRRVARHAGRPAPRRVAAPTWTRRSLSSAGPVSSGLHGIASFYWQPQPLASGGRFDPNAMTAAHRTLPFGTRVRVTHLANGRSVDVKINDRGPYIAGRIIDLSKGAAGVIGMHAQGIAQVRVTILGR